MSLRRGAAALLLAFASRGCVVYEYEHELWLRADGSGSVSVTGRPALWTAFKGLGTPDDKSLGKPDDPAGGATPEAARALFERSGLRVRRADVTRRDGRPYLFVSADFADVNRLAGSPAFPDLELSFGREGDRLKLWGAWKRPATAPDIGARDREGLMAVRFHLPSKIYDHRNAAEAVERGNILSWRQDVDAALAGHALLFGATMDSRSILGSTVKLFAWAIAGALGLLAGAILLAVRKGKRSAPPRRA